MRATHATGAAWASLELFTYLVLRPYFLRLLDNNPKMKGNAKARGETATQMLPRVVCFVHNLMQVRIATRSRPAARCRRITGSKLAAFQSTSSSHAPFQSRTAPSPLLSTSHPSDPTPPHHSCVHPPHKKVPLGLMILTSAAFYQGDGRFYHATAFSTTVMAISAGEAAAEGEGGGSAGRSRHKLALGSRRDAPVCAAERATVSSSPSCHPLPPPKKYINKGYFAYDTLECIVRYQHEGPAFLLHGVFCFLVFTSLTHIRILHWYG